MRGCCQHFESQLDIYSTWMLRLPHPLPACLVLHTATHTTRAQGQATSKSLEVELLRKKLAAADASLASLRGDLQETQQEAAHLRLQVQNMESDAGESQAAAEEQVCCSGGCTQSLLPHCVSS